MAEGIDVDRLREMHQMIREIHRQIVPDYPGADSFGQNREGAELTLRAGLIERTKK